MDPENVLEELEVLLDDLPDESLPPLLLHNEQRTISYAKVSSRFELVTNFVVKKLSTYLIERNVSLPFRVCSIGCGSGHLDSMWIRKLTKLFPDLKIQYVGIDIEETACESAKINLRALAHTDVNILCHDIQDGFKEGQFDFILSVNTFYFFKNPVEVMKICKSSVFPNGLMIFTIAEQKPVSELFFRFWKRHFCCDVCYPPDLTSALKELNILFSDEILSDSIDITECLYEEFVTEFQRNVMNNITQVDTFKYPDAIVKKCIIYLKSVAESSGSKKIIPVYRHFFSIFC